MKTKHPFWQLAEKEDKSDAERVALTALAGLSVHKPYSSMTPEGVYDKLLDNAEKIFNMKRRGPGQFAAQKQTEKFG